MPKGTVIWIWNSDGVYKHDGEPQGVSFELERSPVKISDIPAKGKSIEITNEDIAAQAMIFFFGGFDSTSSLMCFTAYELAVNRDIQGRLRREVRDTWEECQGSLTFDAVSKMTYMDMVVSEVLRKWPNFVFTDRVCSKDYTIQANGPEENSVHLKKRSLYFITNLRFNDENKKKRHPYAYLPFGVGPRTCIGARFATIETKAIFFYILLHFEIVPVEETVIPVVASKKHFNLQPDGLKLGLLWRWVVCYERPGKSGKNAEIDSGVEPVNGKDELSETDRPNGK
ncbi:hypothetical protein NQ318_019128 [Aromia moschata]|uniref:Cytochrome P450 9e2 n=1 Tax=Aromia moschata TaxID=1265417 RepID=A0AAV8YTC0_9CUCU|nr:hypothetical protein NQ318_019128 [Aromia moschata]